MKHLKKGRKFGRKTDERKAFIKSIAVNLIMQEKIKTTDERAKSASVFIEKLITKAKKQTLAARREILKYLPAKAAEKVSKDLALRYMARLGGYTRITKLERRGSDSAKMVILELVK